MCRRQVFDEAVLDMVGVLILVHMDVAVAMLIPFEHIGVGAEELERREEQIVEVERVVAVQETLVDRIDAPGDFLPVGRREAGELARRDAVALRGGDRAEDGARPVLFRVQIEVAQRLLHRVDLIGVVVDGEVPRDADALAVSPQHARAKGVERADRQPVRLQADDPLHAVAHLLRRLVREGDGKDIVRIDVPDREKVGDPVRQDARLAAARPRDDQYGAFRRRDGLSLLRVEAVEDGFFDGHALHYTPCALLARTPARVSVHPYSRVVYMFIPPCGRGCGLRASASV